MVHLLVWLTQPPGQPAAPHLRDGRGLPGLRNTADEQPLLLLVDTTIVGETPYRARIEG